MHEQYIYINTMIAKVSMMRVEPMRIWHAMIQATIKNNTKYMYNMKHVLYLLTSSFKFKMRLSVRLETTYLTFC